MELSVEIKQLRGAAPAKLLLFNFARGSPWKIMTTALNRVNVITASLLLSSLLFHFRGTTSNK